MLVTTNICENFRGAVPSLHRRNLPNWHLLCVLEMLSKSVTPLSSARELL